jgi:hypothetical protein
MNRNPKEIFDDSQELADALRRIAVETGCIYYLNECAEHIEGMYRDLCILQEENEKLKKFVA